MPPAGTGNVNIEEAEKLLKPYLNRYPKVRPTSAGHPIPPVPGGHPILMSVIAGCHLPVLCRAD